MCTDPYQLVSDWMERNPNKTQPLPYVMDEMNRCPGCTRLFASLDPPTWILFEKEEGKMGYVYQLCRACCEAGLSSATKARICKALDGWLTMEGTLRNYRSEVLA